MGSYSCRLLKPFLLAKVAQEVRLANILYGEHANELSILGDRHCPKAALLQDEQTVVKKISLGGDGRNVRFHQVTDKRILTR
jgi:hypothetical protein